MSSSIRPKTIQESEEVTIIQQEPYLIQSRFLIKIDSIKASKARESLIQIP